MATSQTGSLATSPPQLFHVSPVIRGSSPSSNTLPSFSLNDSSNHANSSFLPSSLPANSGTGMNGVNAIYSNSQGNHANHGLLNSVHALSHPQNAGLTSTTSPATSSGPASAKSHEDFVPPLPPSSANTFSSAMSHSNCNYSSSGLQAGSGHLSSGHQVASPSTNQPSIGHQSVIGAAGDSQKTLEEKKASFDKIMAEANRFAKADKSTSFDLKNESATSNALRAHGRSGSISTHSTNPSLIVKVITGGENEVQVRRIPISNRELNHLSDFEQHLCAFLHIENLHKLEWMDEEGDFYRIEKDSDWLMAVQSTLKSGQCHLKVFVNVESHGKSYLVPERRELSQWIKYVEALQDKLEGLEKRLETLEKKSDQKEDAKNFQESTLTLEEKFEASFGLNSSAPSQAMNFAGHPEVIPEKKFSIPGAPNLPLSGHTAPSGNSHLPQSSGFQSTGHPAPSLPLPPPPSGHSASTLPYNAFNPYLSSKSTAPGNIGHVSATSGTPGATYNIGNNNLPPFPPRSSVPASAPPLVNIPQSMIPRTPSGSLAPGSLSMPPLMGTIPGAPSMIPPIPAQQGAASMVPPPIPGQQGGSQSNFQPSSNLQPSVNFQQGGPPMNFQQGVPAFPSQGNFQGSPQMIPAMPGNWQQGSSSHSSQTPSVFNPQAPPQSGGFNPHVQTGFNAQGQPGFNPQGASFGYHQQAPQGAMPPPPPISAALPSKFFPGN